MLSKVIWPARERLAARAEIRREAAGRRRSACQCAGSPSTVGAGIVPIVRPGDYIDRRSSELLGRLQQLVGMATVNPPGEHYATITAWLRDELEAVGLRAISAP